MRDVRRAREAPRPSSLLRSRGRVDQTDLAEKTRGRVELRAELEDTAHFNRCRPRAIHDRPRTWIDDHDVLGPVGIGLTERAHADGSLTQEEERGLSLQRGCQKPSHDDGLADEA